MKHNKCGYEFNVKPVKFLKDGKCPVCDKKRKIRSTGERSIAKYLNDNNIRFETQYIFKDCKYQKYLPFDIAILDSDNNVISLIEYDGNFHFYGNFRGIYTKEKYLATKRNDGIKNNYCKDKNTTLLRIPYWEKDNLDNILNEFFNESSTTIESMDITLIKDGKIIKEMSRS
jgi:hypothetical protein